jgi:hypothetical protein
MMLHRMGLFPSKTDASQYIRFYPLKAKKALLADIERLKAVGLHGKARKVRDRRKENAGQSRRPAKRQQRPPNAQIIAIKRTQQVRLKRDAELRQQNAEALSNAANMRRGRELAAEADARARTALLRSRGEM